MARVAWTEQDDQRLRELYGTHTLNGMSIELHRSIPAIAARIRKLKLARGARDDGDASGGAARAKGSAAPPGTPEFLVVAEAGSAGWCAFDWADSVDACVSSFFGLRACDRTGAQTETLSEAS